MTKAEIQQLTLLLMTHPLNIEACDELLSVNVSYQRIDQKICFLQSIQNNRQVDFLLTPVAFRVYYQNLDSLLTHYLNIQVLATWQTFNIENVTLTSSIYTPTSTGDASQVSDSVGSISSTDRLRMKRERNTNAQTFFYYPDNRESGIQNSPTQPSTVTNELTGSVKWT